MLKLHMCPSQQRGFSLVEIMVAMVIGVVILLAVSEVFIGNNTTRNEIERTGRQIENGTYALSLLTDELSNAGFWGEAGVQSSDNTPPPLCPTSLAELRDALGYPVQGASAGGDCVAAKAGTDSLAVRRASSCAVGTAGCAVASATDFYVQSEACNINTSGSVTVAEGVAGLTGKARAVDCAAAPLAPRYRYLSRLYYITGGDELARMELVGGAYVSSGALVDGIEALHFNYGIDTNNDGRVDEFSVNPAPDQWDDVVEVQIWLVARNSDASPGYTDSKIYSLGGVSYSVAADFAHHKRQVYSATVSLRNISGTREAQ